jgi:predicted NAD/FAD-binding protein
MLRDILRFNRQALADLDNQRIEPPPRWATTFRRKRYGQRFIDHYIVPMGSAIWSMSRADMLASRCSSSCAFAATTACCRSTTARNGG